MSTKTFKTRIQLRKDLENSYQASFVPLKGEVLLVDTASEGLRSKVGDGIHTFAQLEYTDKYLRDQLSGIVVKGYFFNGSFYADEEHKITIVPYDYKVYIDITAGKYDIYVYGDLSFHKAVEIPTATSTSAGIMKLYDTTGHNTDGTMTQDAITTEIGKKCAVAKDDDEGLVFTHGITL